MKLILILSAFLVAPSLWACSISKVGGYCTKHVACDEVHSFKYQGDTCYVDSWTMASCSAIALKISLKSKNDGEECRIKVRKEVE